MHMEEYNAQILMIFNRGLATSTASTAPTPLESPITDRLKDSCSQNKGITCTHIGLSHKIDQWGSMEDGTSLQITNSAVQHCDGALQIAFDCLLSQCLHIDQNKL